MSVQEPLPGQVPNPVPGADRDNAPARSSVWLVAQRTLTVQRRGRFTPESGEHPGRMAPDLAAEAIRRYTRPGDLVLDPMCGIGTTLVEAMHAGRDAIGIEYEPRWADIARANVSRASAQGAAGHATVLTGDARSLNHLGIRPVRLVLTSPPYGPSPHGRVDVPGVQGPAVSHQFDHYIESRNRGPATINSHDGRTCTGSDHRHRGGESERANLAYVGPDELRAGMAQILRSCSALLTSDGFIVVTARPWRREGILIDLPGLVITAAEQAGLTVADRCVAVLAGSQPGRLIPRHSFLQLLHGRAAWTRGIPQLLIAHEDVLVMQVRHAASELPGGRDRTLHG